MEIECNSPGACIDVSGYSYRLRCLKFEDIFVALARRFHPVCPERLSFQQALRDIQMAILNAYPDIPFKMLTLLSRVIKNHCIKENDHGFLSLKLSTPSKNLNIVLAHLQFLDASSVSSAVRRLAKRYNLAWDQSPVVKHSQDKVNFLARMRKLGIDFM